MPILVDCHSAFGRSWSSAARSLMRLLDDNARIVGGEVRFQGRDVLAMTPDELRDMRGNAMSMVFQDPYSSLDPRMTIGEILAEPLQFHGLTKAQTDTRRRVEELLGQVGLASRMAARYPHEFSGGQRQRVSIARAPALEPEFIIADEPISSLDVDIQTQILNLMMDLQERLGLTYLFIAHDLAVVRHICDRIVVLYLGRVAEIAPARELFTNSQHPYTRYLVSSVPIGDAAAERQRQRLPLQGEPPSAVNPPSGCRFRTRCPIARTICAQQQPPLTTPGGRSSGHVVACHFPGRF